MLDVVLFVRRKLALRVMRELITQKTTKLISKAAGGIRTHDLGITNPPLFR